MPATLVTFITLSRLIDNLLQLHWSTTQTHLPSLSSAPHLAEMHASITKDRGALYSSHLMQSRSLVHIIHITVLLLLV